MSPEVCWQFHPTSQGEAARRDGEWLERGDASQPLAQRGERGQTVGEGVWEVWCDAVRCGKKGACRTIRWDCFVFVVVYERKLV